MRTRRRHCKSVHWVEMDWLTDTTGEKHTADLSVRVTGPDEGLRYLEVLSAVEHVVDNNNYRAGQRSEMLRKLGELE